MYSGSIQLSTAVFFKTDNLKLCEFQHHTSSILGDEVHTSSSSAKIKKQLSTNRADLECNGMGLDIKRLEKEKS